MNQSALVRIRRFRARTFLKPDLDQPVETVNLHNVNFQSIPESVFGVMPSELMELHLDLMTAWGRYLAMLNSLAVEYDTKNRIKGDDRRTRERMGNPVRKTADKETKEVREQ